MKHWLVLARGAEEQERVAQHMAYVIYNFGGENFSKYLPSIPKGLAGAKPEAIASWIQKNVHKAKDLEIPGITNAMRQLSSFYKQGIQLSIYPHGFFNVGMITSMRGGISTAAQGLKHLNVIRVNRVTGQPMPKVIADGLARLHANGGSTSYWRDPMNAPKILGMLGKQYAHLINHFSEQLDDFENAYRLAYLQHIDKRVATGDPTIMKELGFEAGSEVNHIELELAKGRMVTRDIGDYTNTTKFVQALQSIGGVFAQFSSGIAPKAVMNSRMNQGLLGARHQLPMAAIADRANENFDNDVHPGAVMGGPVTDSDELELDPLKALTRTSRVGPIAAGVASYLNKAPGGQAHPPSVLRFGQSVAENTNPVYQIAEHMPGLGGLNPNGQQPALPAFMYGYELLAPGYVKSGSPSARTIRRARKNLYKPE
jgi:hypothetical protein